MDYDSDDLLYGALQYLATYHPELHLLYLTKKNYTKSKQELMAICGLDSRGIKRHLDRLIEKGLIKEKKIYIGANQVEYECFTFPYNHKEKYQIINNEMLWYVVSTRNKQAVRIYIYLLNKYLWKKESGEAYEFSNKELVEALGYSPKGNNTLASSMVSNILESFKREGVIDYNEYYEQRIDNCGRQVPVPKKALVFVANSKNQLKSVS
jgi:DNA-binding Lrp family transcriptional regulator